MSSVYSTPEWAAWMASIREMPDDDNRRLIAADFLEENGEGERAEFIRLQVEYRRAKTKTQRTPHRRAIKQFMRGAVTLRKYPWFNHILDGCDFGFSVDGWHCVVGDFSNRGSVDYWRGFVSRVSGPLVSLIGGRGCNRCVGGGREPTDRHGNVYVGVCPDCNGTGRTPGVLRELVRREPVGFVEVTDVTPHQLREGVSWVRDDNGEWTGGVHCAVFDLIQTSWHRANGHQKAFINDDEARAALSAALLRLVQPVEVPT